MPFVRQISILVEELKIESPHVDTPTEQKLCLSFESSGFCEGWQGVIVFRFTTGKALSFQRSLLAIGAQQGTAAEVGR